MKLDNPRRRFCVYIAGPMRGETELHLLTNLDEFAAWTAAVFERGFSPYPVCGDSAYLAKVRPTPGIEQVHCSSLQWVPRCDAVFVLPGWQHSSGALEEVHVAERHGKPVFSELDDLCKWADDLVAVDRVDPVRAAEELIGKTDD